MMAYILTWNQCLPDGGWMHATNQSNAQGTAFAIAYESDLSKINMEDLVVFSVLRQFVSSLLIQANESLPCVAHRGIGWRRTRCHPECPNVLQVDALVLTYG
jgi:hypothetical protein